MAIRSAVDIVTQFGVENTPGNPVSGNRFAPTISWMLKRKLANQSFRAQGSKVQTSQAQHKKWGEGAFDGVLDYNSIIYVLSGLFNHAAAAPLGASGGHKRIYQPGVRTSDSGRKTYTFVKGDATRAERYAFGQIKSATFEATQDSATVKGALFSRYAETGQTLPASPTVIKQRPIERDQIDLFFASLGTDFKNASGSYVQLTQARSETLTIADKFKEAWFHNSALASFGEVVELPYDATFGFSLADSTVCQNLLALIIDNPVVFFRWKATGAQIGLDGATPVFELLQFDMAVRFDEPEELGDDEGIYGYKFMCRLEDDADLGRHLEITSVNSIASAAF